MMRLPKSLDTGGSIRRGGLFDTGAPPVEAGECSTSDTRCGADNTVETCVDSYWKQTAKCMGTSRCAPRVRARRVSPVSSGAPTRPISKSATRAGNGSLTAPVRPRPRSASKGNAPFASQALSVAPATYPSSAARRATRGNARRRAPGPPPRASKQRPLAVAAPRGPCSATEMCHSAAMPPGNGSLRQRAAALPRNVSRAPVWRAIRARGPVDVV